MSTTRPTPNTSGLVAAVTTFLTAPVRAQTYKNLLYVGLQFPLGLTYFVVLVPVLALGVGTLPLLLLLGAPALGALLLGVAVMTFDRAVTELLLPVELDRHTAGSSLDDGVVTYARDLLLDPGTYLSLGFVLAKFVVGLATFVTLTVTGVFVAVFVTAPLLYANPATNYTFPLPAGGTVVVDTLPEATALAVLGVVLLFVSANLLNATAWLLGRATVVTCRYARVLGASSDTDRQDPPVDHA